MHTISRSLGTNKGGGGEGVTKLVKQSFINEYFVHELEQRFGNRLWLNFLLHESRYQFTHTSIDYAGPLSIKCKNNKNIKIQDYFAQQLDNHQRMIKFHVRWSTIGTQLQTADIGLMEWAKGKPK